MSLRSRVSRRGRTDTWPVDAKRNPWPDVSETGAGFRLRYWRRGVFLMAEDNREILSLVGVKADFDGQELKRDARPHSHIAYVFPNHPGDAAMKQAWFFAGSMDADADGSPRAYKADDKAPGTALDKVGHAHDGDDWFGVVTILNGAPSVSGKGTPYVQTKERGDPYPGFYVSKTSLQDRSITDFRNPKRFVDPEVFPYVVLPGRGTRVVKKKTEILTPDGQAHTFNGTQIGDLAYVVSPSTNRSFGAVIAEGGPWSKAGEGSIRLLEQLGFPGCTGNSSPSATMLFIYFPGSAGRIGWPATETAIDQAACSLFQQWGGVDRLKKAFPDQNLTTLSLNIPAAAPATPPK